MMRPGHISLPNGLGRHPHARTARPVGVAPNELTSSDHRDPIAGTPYHKHVPRPPRARFLTGLGRRTAVPIPLASGCAQTIPHRCNGLASSLNVSLPITAGKKSPILKEWYENRCR